MISREELRGRVEEISRRIAEATRASGRSPGAVKLVAVTKTHPAELVQLAAECGISHVGENRVQEATVKIAEFAHSPAAGALQWHLIGHLQSNKAKVAVKHFELIHSVDSLSLAQELNRHAAAAGKVQRVLLQANVSGEESKFGFPPEDAPMIIDGILESCPALQVEGLMTIAPLLDNAEQARPHFAALRRLRDELAKRYAGENRLNLHELSMGMTGDFEAAIAEGATLVRIGSALFGAREP